MTAIPSHCPNCGLVANEVHSSEPPRCIRCKEPVCKSSIQEAFENAHTSGVFATKSAPPFRTFSMPAVVADPALAPGEWYLRQERELAAALERRVAGVMRHRERYVKAWIAQTGLKPSEAEIVEEHHPSGTVVVRVRKRREVEG